VTEQKGEARNRHKKVGSLEDQKERRVPLLLHILSSTGGSQLPRETQSSRFDDCYDISTFIYYRGSARGSVPTKIRDGEIGVHWPCLVVPC
jgi:hypothetical protein